MEVGLRKERVKMGRGCERVGWLFEPCCLARMRVMCFVVCEVQDGEQERVPVVSQRFLNAQAEKQRSPASSDPPHSPSYNSHPFPQLTTSTNNGHRNPRSFSITRYSSSSSNGTSSSRKEWCQVVSYDGCFGGTETSWR